MHQLRHLLFGLRCGVMERGLSRPCRAQSRLDACQRRARPRPGRASRRGARRCRLSSLPQPYELHRILPEGAVADLLDRRAQTCDRRARMETQAMNPALYLAQRGTAFVLAFAVTIHLVTIIYAIRGGLTAGEILARTHGNRWFLGFYLVFVIAAAIHAPIGLRSILREWAKWRTRSLDVAMLAFSGLLLVLGVRAALAVYLA